ncbi:hypothetical protein KMC57_gp43 [Achromobacter phage vB_AxyP_19-32_Axy24]|uniref:Uncharacterized protein n=3 Tax=Dongdastvirus TaxID=2842653 RepID=A0A514CUE6_9CAUD|nr:hypothetical protein ADP65_00073 [Achromobacter phage phiAxp-3]YP_010079123.1 hypothetical protein KMC56_gp44 [Achromobacter phage vB_AxyP_19-32_Axy12]YP_010079205.1 hypothetical protein KMC57_gp43 [Achromobacter phage vB_AxyP_19-32_Axy24]ALA45542.1 hypothetical protein ADP65_00073 [Achromobacter phage phiAxp-3]QDH84105.1 hypothetical protein Axy12_075 [Achromobacter phage vB_AxyP_19-32_Axy12]QDH84748.1 hypothetical protein Axy24_075 [Achromobacter phage vB_AxyP_19-32_Axy24]
MLTKQEIIQALPPNLKSAVTDQFVDMVNDITQDQQAAEYIRENFITYTMVLKEGRFKTEDYLNAVAYVSYKHMGLSNKEAFFKTFPQRQVALVAKGTSEKDIAAHVAGYHKGKLVNLIMEKSLVPTWVAYQDVYHKAIAVQADLMQNAQSEKVRSDAANSILTHLAKPKEAAAVVNVDLRENSGMKELVATLTQLAGAQRQAISDGTDAKVISGASLIREKEVTNV